MNCYHTSIQMCGQYCILAPFCHNVMRWVEVDIASFQIKKIFQSINISAMLVDSE